MKMHRTHRRGVALVWLAIMGLVLLGIAGLAIDTGYVYLVSRQLQDAADAAALAAAINLHSDVSPYTAETNLAISTAALNKAAGTSVQVASSDVTFGNWSDATGFTSPPTGAPTAVRVIAKRTTGSTGGAVNLFFGPIVGISSVESSRTAIAHTGGDPSGAGLVVLGTTGTDINIGNAVLKIVSTDAGNKGRIWVNSNGSSGNAVIESSNSTIVADDLYAVAGSSSLQLSGTYTGVALHPNSPAMPDPLAFLPTLSTSGLTTDASNGQFNSGTVHLSGGKIYPLGIKVSGASVILDGGIYYIGSSGHTTGLDLSSGSLSAPNGAFIYLAFGSLTINGGVSSVSLTPLTTGSYAGVSVFQAHGNTAQASLTGSANLVLDGALYFPDSSLVSLSGSGGVQSTGNQIIASAIKMTSGTFNLTYNGNTAFKSTAIMIPNGRPYLVK